MNRFVILLLSLAFVSSTAWSQSSGSLTGQVVDGSTELALSRNDAEGN